MESMLKAMKMRRGGVDKFTAKVAKKAGPDCRQLQIFDAMAMLTWATELFEEIAQQSGDLGEDEDLPTPSGKPVMLSSTTSAGPDGYSSSINVKTSEMSRLIDIILELSELMDDMDDDGEEDSQQ